MSKEGLLATTKRVVWNAPVGAVTSDGFIKATLYSFASFACVWGIALLKEDATLYQLGRYAVLIPLVNSLLVLVKQYIDEFRN